MDLRTIPATPSRYLVSLPCLMDACNFSAQSKEERKQRFLKDRGLVPVAMLKRGPDWVRYVRGDHALRATPRDRHFRLRFASCPGRSGLMRISDFLDQAEAPKRVSLDVARTERFLRKHGLGEVIRFRDGRTGQWVGHVSYREALAVVRQMDLEKKAALYDMLPDAVKDGAAGIPSVETARGETGDFVLLSHVMVALGSTPGQTAGPHRRAFIEKHALTTDRIITQPRGHLYVISRAEADRVMGSSRSTKAQNASDIRSSDDILRWLTDIGEVLAGLRFGMWEMAKQANATDAKTDFLLREWGVKPDVLAAALAASKSESGLLRVMRKCVKPPGAPDSLLLAG